jgi:hypothetical protein
VPFEGDVLRVNQRIFSKKSIRRPAPHAHARSAPQSSTLRASPLLMSR